MLLWSLGFAIWSFADDRPRAARSVHLGYPAPDALVFYNEVTVEESVPGSYFMVCGWNGGYFGIQQLGNNDKVAIFSIWDSDENNPSATPQDKRVEVLYKADDVKVSRFGGEGSGAKSMTRHDWKIGEPQRFLLQAQIEGEKTTMTAFIFTNDKKEWKKLATFRAHSRGSPLRGLYSFVEDFRRDGKSAIERRCARFGNGWVKTTKGEWTALTRAKFTASGATWEAKETIDAGVINSDFYLATGDNTKMSTPLNSTISRPSRDLTPPALDLK